MKSLITLPALLGALALSTAMADEHHDRPIDINAELRRIELKVALESYARILDLRSEAALDLALLDLEPGNANTAARRQAQQRRVQILSKLAKETENRARQIHSQMQPHSHPHETFDDFDEKRSDRDRWRRDPMPIPSDRDDVPDYDLPARDDAFDRTDSEPGPVPTRDRPQRVDQPRNLPETAESTDDFAEPRNNGLRNPTERPRDEPTDEPSDFSSDDVLSPVTEDSIGP